MNSLNFISRLASQSTLGAITLTTFTLKDGSHVLMILAPYTSSLALGASVKWSLERVANVEILDIVETHVLWTAAVHSLFFFCDS